MEDPAVDFPLEADDLAEPEDFEAPPVVLFALLEDLDLVVEPDRLLPEEADRVRVFVLVPELELEPERLLLDFLRAGLEAGFGREGGEGREGGSLGRGAPAGPASD